MNRKLVFMALGFMTLLIMPVFIELHHLALYYVSAVAATAVGLYRLRNEAKLDERFAAKWRHRREAGKWANAVRDGWFYLVNVVVVISYTRYLVYNQTPVELFRELPHKAFIWLMVWLIGLSLLTGFISWFEKEKRYWRIESEKW